VHTSELRTELNGLLDVNFLSHLIWDGQPYYTKIDSEETCMKIKNIYYQGVYNTPVVSIYSPEGLFFILLTA